MTSLGIGGVGQSAASYLQQLTGQQSAAGTAASAASAEGAKGMHHGRHHHGGGGKRRKLWHPIASHKSARHNFPALPINGRLVRPEPSG